MARPLPTPLPDLTPERLLDRIAEGMQVGLDPSRLKSFPVWTRHVMLILKEQFLPREFAGLLAGGESIFVEGVAVAWVAKARDIAEAADSGGGRFARKLAERLALDAPSREIAERVETGELAGANDFQEHVMRRLFAADFNERRAFVEGLAVGNRLPELLDRQAKRNTTDATGIYLLLWFYWPEISQLKSIGEVARVLEPFFAKNKNLTGAHWEERIRKLANRLGLSFRSKQQRQRKLR